MTDLIDGLGGPAGFGEMRGPRFDDEEVTGIDVTSVFEDGIRLFDRSYDTISISSNGYVLLGDNFTALSSSLVRRFDEAGFYVFWSDHLPRQTAADLPDTPRITPGGTSQGSNAIWYDLDTEADALTVTWDDVAPFGGDRSDRNAYQLRLVDISDEPGRSDGAFVAEFRYEAVEWARGNSGAAGFAFGDDLNAFTLPASRSVEGQRALPESGVIAFTFDGETVTSTLPGLPEIPLFGPPITGTTGNDRLVGTDDNDVIRPGRGRDTIEPGLGRDIIELGNGPKTIIGTAAELFGDALRGDFSDDRMLFRDLVFDRDAVTYSGRQEALLFDIDGDGTEDGRIDWTLSFGDRVLPLTATTEAGTFLAPVARLPKLAIRNSGEDRWSGDRNTEAYLSGDGETDFLLRLDEVSTTRKDGLALGVYTYDRQGNISDVRLLTTDVRETGAAEYLLEDVARGETVAVFLVNPDETGALDDIDSFAFVDETGGAAGFDDGSYVFAQIDGEIVSAEVMHSARNSLNADLQQRALIGMSDRPGLTIVMEDGLFDGRDFNDVVLSIERLAVEVI